MKEMVEIEDVHINDEIKKEDVVKISTKKSNFRQKMKQITIIVVALLNLVDALAEIVIGLYVDSLALFSDGIHNLSDVLTLIIAFWVNF